MSLSRKGLKDKKRFWHVNKFITFSSLISNEIQVQVTRNRNTQANRYVCLHHQLPIAILIIINGCNAELKLQMFFL